MQFPFAYIYSEIKLTCLLTVASRLTMRYLETTKLKFYKILSKLRYYIPKETLTSIYNSLFYSYILYGSASSCYTSQKDILKIFIPKKEMRLFTFSEFQEHTTPILRKL